MVSKCNLINPKKMKKIYFQFFLLLFFLSSSVQVSSQVNSSRSFNYLADSVIKHSVVQNDPVSISVFPNPASKSITFTFKGLDLEFVKVQVFEITGGPVKMFIPENSQYTMDLTMMKEGIYFYNVQYNGKVVKTEKFVVLKK